MTRTKLRIAQIAPIIERVPPKKYGGTERVVHALTEELVQRGHDVTLFASGDSITSAKLVSVYSRGLREARIKEMYGLNTLTLSHIGLAYSMQDQFDIIHDHNGHISLPTANIARTPVVMTMHGPFNLQNRLIFKKLNNPHIVTISNSQAIIGINHIGTVYNGLDLVDYPFSEKHDGYLLYVGRICEEKGVHVAVEAAKSLDLPLIIAAKLEPVDLAYFKQKVEPELNEDIRWIGEVDENERNKLYSRAMAFLHPVLWREPFGLTLIEAMACGCPVIAFNRGSIPEIVKSGETGFVVNDIDELLDKIGEIDKIDRKKCRDHALIAFNTREMTDGYEQIYKKIIREQKVKQKKAQIARP
jgi:glycosyltransferase involved in cell wall biosynthesis